MSDTSCAKCGDTKGSCSTTTAVQNGKGDAPRNMSRRFRSNYDGINWGSSSKKSTSKAASKTTPKKASRR